MQKHFRSIQIGRWRVEPALNRLWDGSAEQTLEPREMSLLTLLAANPDTEISEESIVQSLWPDLASGEEGPLVQSVSMLRDALGDDGRDSTYIETIPGIGYRLIAPVSKVVLDTPETQMPAMPTPDISDHRQGLTLLVATVLGVAALGVMGFQHFFGD